MRTRFGWKRAVGLASLTLWLVVGLASVGSAYRADTGAGAGPNCSLPSQITKYEPALQAQCVEAPVSAVTSTDRAVSSPSEVPGVSLDSAILPALAAVALGAAAIVLRIRARQLRVA